MTGSALYSRDLLYITDNIYEPGSVHIEILSPSAKGKMHVLIESKTSHSPIKYMDSIIGIMQTDIFDRIHIDVKSNLSLYISVKDDEELKKQSGGNPYIKVIFNGDDISYKGVPEIAD